MNVDFELADDGLEVALDGRHARVRWPTEVWAPFADKRAFATELVFLMTYGLALGRNDPVIRYGFGPPRFVDTYDRWFDATRPYLADVALWGEKPQRVFSSTAAPPAAFPTTEPGRAVAALTLGKDSLASLVIAQELGLDVAAVNCQHPSLSDDFQLRGPAMRALGAELGIAVHSVIDDVKALSAAAASPGHSSGILWSMGIASYCLLLAPFAAFHRARYLLVGNEYDLNHPTLAASGARVTQAHLQTAAGMGELDEWIEALTSGAVRLTSPIHSLYRLAGHKLIHALRPHVGVHQISCRKATAARRWCGACKTCAENSLFIRAMGRDPATLGLDPMFDEAQGGLYFLLSHGLDPGDPYRFHLAEQELLAFATIDPGPTWVQRAVGERFRADRDRLERTYLAPAQPITGLPLAPEAFACARRLLG